MALEEGNFKFSRRALITWRTKSISTNTNMNAKVKKRRGGNGHNISFEVDDLFDEDVVGKGMEREVGQEVEQEAKMGAKKKNRQGNRRKGGERGRKTEGGTGVERLGQPSPQLAVVGVGVNGTSTEGRWKPRRGFRIFAEADEMRGDEHLRVHRRWPSPEIFDETLFGLMRALHTFSPQRVFCCGSVFPAVAAGAAGAASSLVVGQDVDQRTMAAILNLVPGAMQGSLDEGGFDLVLFCHDHLTGEKAANAVVEAAGHLSDGGVVVACFPAEALLDYSTNIRMEAPNMRNKVHRLCRTHFVLRAAGPLMQPSWDIMVMGRRGGQADPPICKWRFTGSGVLPWQKCNEAFSSAPWLLVESIDQSGPAIARCINYPWEAFSEPAAR